MVKLENGKWKLENGNWGRRYKRAVCFDGSCPISIF
jgi:hypothetical protein